MALADFVELSLYTTDGSEMKNVRINKLNIIDVRVVNIGKRGTQNQNWYIQVNMLLGKFYYIKTPLAPYASYNDAVAARDAWLNTF